jgi:sec-independent protein translocase protein TatB
MNPGIGLPEMLVVLVIALVVVGPQQLPVLMRRIGRIAGQARSMAREFQRSFDEIGREAELDELRKEIAAIKKANPVAEIQDEVKGAAQDASIEAEAIRQLKLRDAGLPSDLPRDNQIAPPQKPGAKPVEKPVLDKPVAPEDAEPVEKAIKPNE